MAINLRFWWYFASNKMIRLLFWFRTFRWHNIFYKCVDKGFS